MTWGIPTDVFLQIHINVSLPPCASKRHFAKRPMAVARLGGRAQRTASFAVWPNEPSQPDATGSSVAGWPNEPDGLIGRRSSDQRDRRPQFVQANRIRHNGTIWAERTQDAKQDDVTSPIAQIRQEKPPRGLRYHGQTNRRGRPVGGWAEMSDSAERTQSRGTRDACTFSLSAQSAYSPFG